MLLRKFKIQGHSMEPTIKNGSEILVSNIPYLFSKPKTGDIVVFNNFNKVMIKRIKKIKSDHYFLEGDNTSDTLDVGWIGRKDILGKIIFNF